MGVLFIRLRVRVKSFIVSFRGLGPTSLGLGFRVQEPFASSSLSGSLRMFCLLGLGFRPRRSGLDSTPIVVEVRDGFGLVLVRYVPCRARPRSLLLWCSGSGFAGVLLAASELCFLRWAGLVIRCSPSVQPSLRTSDVL